MDGPSEKIKHAGIKLRHIVADAYLATTGIEPEDDVNQQVIELVDRGILQTNDAIDAVMICIGQVAETAERARQVDELVERLRRLLQS